MAATEPRLFYLDDAIAVCVKPPEWLSEPGPKRNLPEFISSCLYAQNKPNELFTVHRLDKPVGGLTVLARSGACAGTLIAQIAARTAQKEYYAVVCGKPEKPSGILEDLLFHDASCNKTFVVDRERKGVRKAGLEYKTLETVTHEGRILSLVRIRLFTGRTHQIRAQFSSRSMPLLGDVRYGSRDSRCGVALWSCMLRFEHPTSGRQVTYYLRPEKEYPWDLFSDSCFVAPSPFTPTAPSK